MRTIAIGDIHGQIKHLDDLLEKLNINFSQDKVVFLGDYIDRGADSYAVYKRVRGLQEDYPNNVICLRGNHEEMAIEAVGNSFYHIWNSNGGLKTLKDFEDHNGNIIEAVKWFETLPYYYETDNNIFVHAGIEPNLSMDEQDKYYMVWAREEYLYSEAVFPKRVISGHSPSIYETDETFGRPYKTIADNIVIDSGCFFSGTLTACIIEETAENINYKIVTTTFEEENKIGNKKSNSKSKN